LNYFSTIFYTAVKSSFSKNVSSAVQTNWKELDPGKEDTSQCSNQIITKIPEFDEQNKIWHYCKKNSQEKGQAFFSRIIYLIQQYKFGNSSE